MSFFVVFCTFKISDRALDRFCFAKNLRFFLLQLDPITYSSGEILRPLESSSFLYRIFTNSLANIASRAERNH